MSNTNFSKHFNDQEPIMDSIYGVIKISLFEKMVLNTKEMQRLRGIKQLGFVNLVFPDAEHSRFAHSIGVSHQAKLLIEHVNNNIANVDKYNDWRSIFKNSIPKSKKDGKKDSSVTIDGIREIERIVIAAAALLHDLPHSPFSHEIESNNPGGIPIHDKFETNPVLFQYLFNTTNSELAKVIEFYNRYFWPIFQKDEKWGEIFTDDLLQISNGYIKISEDSNAVLVGNSKQFVQLPILGVMIFEVLLFDKVNMWLKEKDGYPLPQMREDGVKVKIDFKDDVISWKPIPGWFRPYRKDIVANTICADLLDYLLRDGKNTGILATLDLKFFDRMTIVKAIPEKTKTLIPLKDIPDMCEHIVFDIFDHKRGIIRQSIITEIISFLQQRYLLAERVYDHRVVEAARSMLQEVSRLLVSKNLIEVSMLHDTNELKASPISDDAFFSWVLNLPDKEHMEISYAKQLVKMLKERRIFREIVIIDGMQDIHQGSRRGPEVNCNTLAEKLLNEEVRRSILTNLNSIVKRYREKDLELPDPAKIPVFTLGVRPFGKRYKVPKVLVSKPLSTAHFNDIEVFPLFDGKKLPSIPDRLGSMQHAYDSLWKVYLFAHPHLHDIKYEKLNSEIAGAFIKLLFDYTGIDWNNSIDSYLKLLPQYPIDVTSFVQRYAPMETAPLNDNFLAILLEEINNKIPVGREEFRLNNNSKGVLMSYIEKLDPNILKEMNLQDKIISTIRKASFSLPVAAKDHEETTIKKTIDIIRKALNEEEKKLL